MINFGYIAANLRFAIVKDDSMTDDLESSTMMHRKSPYNLAFLAQKMSHIQRPYLLALN